MEQRSPEERLELIADLKVTRERLRDLLQKEKDLSNELKGVEVPGERPFTIDDWPRFVFEILRMMESDDDYRYETSSPRYDGKNFIATTANINEYQSRLFGPLRHEEMRRMFLAFVRQLEQEGVGFAYRRTTMRYNYVQGDDADTGFRIEIPITYLKGGGPSS